MIRIHRRRRCPDSHCIPHRIRPYRFIELANAYDTLSDATKRQRYDDLGDTGGGGFADFNEAFKHAQAHGAVEDTPLNWFGLACALLLSVAPVARRRAIAIPRNTS